MWRLERMAQACRRWLPAAHASRYVLRLGQSQLQLWKIEGRRLLLQASRSTAHIGYRQFQAIADEVAELVQVLPANSRVQVLVDSKWMPVTLLNTGRAPLSAAQVQALALHRFAQAYGDEAESWRVQTNYVSGNEQAVAFGCSEQLLIGLRQGLGHDAPNSPARTKLMGVQPTFCWVWNQVRNQEAKVSDDWLTFAEQDRSILLRLVKGRVRALQPVGPILQSAEQLAAALPSQAVRCGLVEGAEYQALGVSLEPCPDTSMGTGAAAVRWHAIGRHESEVPL